MAVTVKSYKLQVTGDNDKWRVTADIILNTTKHSMYYKEQSLTSLKDTKY